MANILQSEVMTQFIYPFLLIFFIVFAILEKTKMFGAERKQVHALISLVISLIFVSAIFPKIIVSNLMLFLVLGLVIIFVGLLMWGFISGKEAGENLIGAKTLKWFGGFLILAIIVAVVWASGLGGGFQKIFDFMFNQEGSAKFWTNFLIIAFVIGAVVAVLNLKSK